MDDLLLKTHLSWKENEYFYNCLSTWLTWTPAEPWTMDHGLSQDLCKWTAGPWSHSKEVSFYHLIIYLCLLSTILFTVFFVWIFFHAMQSVKSVQYKHIKFVWTNDNEPDINSQMTKLSIKPQLVVDAMLRSACVLVVPPPLVTWRWCWIRKLLRHDHSHQPQASSPLRRRSVTS